MSLNYDHIAKKSNEENNFWTSNAELATVLSILFLFLYAISILRTTTMSVQQAQMTQEKLAEMEQLKEQIHTYEILKEGYIKKGATPKEREFYEKVMSQMKLLEDTAKSEKEAAMAKMEENAEKERGLSQYQQVIKNIINANVIAQSKLKKKEKIIAEKAQDIRELSSLVKNKEKELSSNNAQIFAIQNKLEKSINEIKYAYRSKERSKKKAEEEIAKLRDESNTQVGALQRQNVAVARQLNSAKGMIVEQSQEIQRKNTQVAQLEQEKNRALGDLERKSTGYQRAISELESAHQQRLANEKAAFERGLAAEKLSGASALEREKAYRGSVEAAKGEYEGKLRNLEGQLAGTQNAIRQQETQYKQALGKLSSEKGGLEKELGELKAREDDRRKLAADLKANFARAGIDVDINARTGEVIVHFGGEYFEYGSANLKGGMQAVLQRALPVYADTLFKDPVVSKRISSVEIVGFASPTYAGKYVNPRDLSSNARQAVNYNMDLSYRRAKSIFEYVFDTKRMNYPHQNELFRLTKVSGHSYLRSQEAADPKVTRDLSDAEYCEKYDCSKSQKVLIKFNFSER